MAGAYHVPGLFFITDDMKRGGKNIIENHKISSE